MHTLLWSFCLSGLLFFGNASAEEIFLKHRGHTLNAAMEFAQGKTLADGVILMTHGGLVHRDMETIAVLRQLLQAKGYNTLAINLSLGLDNRHGPYDCAVVHRHRNEDAAEEIGVWVDWLARQGARNITLLGHSRGGAQTALYVAGRDNPVLKSVVLLAPAVRENTGAAEYRLRTKKALAPVLEQARALVQTGKGERELKHVGILNCPDTSASAASFVSYYGQTSSVDSPSLIPKIKMPTLVLVAGADEVVRGLAPKIAPLADGQGVWMKVIEGSDHTFRDLNAYDAVDAIDDFLQR